jgi:hypothetical protein
LEGAEVRYPFEVSLGDNNRVDEQIDGVVYADGLACLLECKDWQKPVDNEPIAKLRDQLSRRPSSAIGLCFSRLGFTDPALRLASRASGHTVLLWGGVEIEFALHRQLMRRALIAKYRFCVEFGLVSFDITRRGAL